MESKNGSYGGKRQTLYKWNCKCGSHRWLPRYEIKRFKFCRRDCPAKTQQRVMVNCAQCAEQVERLPSKLKSKSGLYFCSKKCLDSARSIGGLDAVRPEHYGTSIRRKVFRGHCVECGCELWQSRNGNGKYCTPKCQQANQSREYIERWLLGLEDANRKGGLRPAVSHTIRAYLFEINNNQCQQCGWGERSEYTGKIPLQVDHIDGDSTRSTSDNLRLLCPNCHTLTPFYGSLNKGRGRKDKLDYYHKNKLTI